MKLKSRYWSCLILKLLELHVDELKSDSKTAKAVEKVLMEFLVLDGSKKLEMHQLVEEIRLSYKRCLSL